MTEKRFSVALRKHTTQYELVDNWKTGDYPFIEPFYYKKTANDLANFLNQLQEENEQLKTRNDNQAKQLDNLYQLIEQKDWRALTKIIDDFKQSDEQLQKEWGTYGDVE